MLTPLGDDFGKKGTTGSDEKKEEFRWKVIFVCDSCNPFYKEINTNDEERANKYQLFHKSKKKVGTHKEQDPNTKCNGHIAVKSWIDLQRQGKKEQKKIEKRRVKQFTKTYNDVIGLNNAKEELKDEMSAMTIYRTTADDYNIELDDGIILSGKPGIGKTILAQASVNEPEFKGLVELYGEGKFYVKDFTGGSQESTSEKIVNFFDSVENRYHASEKKVQLIIINEIDGILRYDRESTINDARLSTFLSITGNNIGHYLIIGTTNKPLFNDATTRRGRFKLIRCDPPNDAERLALAKKYLSELKTLIRLTEDDYTTIRDITPGWAGNDYASFKTDIFKWHSKSRDKGIIPNDYVVTIKDVTNLIEIDNNRREQEKVLTEKKRPGQQPICEPVSDIPTFKVSNKSNEQQQFIDNEINKMHQTGRRLVLYYVGTGKSNPRTDLIDLTVEEIARKDPAYYVKSIKPNLLVIQALRGEEIVLTDNDIIMGTYIKTEEPKKDEQEVEIDIIADYARQLVEIERKEEPKKEEPKKEEPKKEEPKKEEPKKEEPKKEEPKKEELKRDKPKRYEHADEKGCYWPTEEELEATFPVDEYEGKEVEGKICTKCNKLFSHPNNEVVVCYDCSLQTI